MTELRYIAADGVVLELHDPAAGYGVIDIQGAGMPPVEHQSVTAPNRDGEVWVRALLGTRYLKVKLLLKGASQAQRHALRMAIIGAMNPRLGLGALEYAPYAGAPTYTIGAVIADGLGFDGTARGVAADEALVSLRCPDPAWRVAAEASVTTTREQGLSFPLSVPVSISDGTRDLTIVNGGQLEAYPRITVTAGALGADRVRMVNTTTGDVLEYTVTLAAGESLVIDTDARTATIDGANAMRYRTAESASPWKLAAGANAVTIGTSTGTVTATLAYDERYLGL